LEQNNTQSHRYISFVFTRKVLVYIQRAFMRLKFIIPFAFFLLSAITSFSQAPESADVILKKAFTQAAKENKKVFVLFHASWCGWCHKMDTAMNDASVKKFFTDNYVIEHLTVYESKGKERLENPRALALLTKYNGNDEGIPY